MPKTYERSGPGLATIKSPTRESPLEVHLSLQSLYQDCILCASGAVMLKHPNTMPRTAQRWGLRVGCLGWVNKFLQVHRATLLSSKLEEIFPKPLDPAKLPMLLQRQPGTQVYMN